MCDGEARRHRRPFEPELATGAQREVELRLPCGQAAGDQLVDPQLLERDDLELRRVLSHARDLARMENHDAAPVCLGVEERVRDRDRDLVPKLRGADRVAVHQQVGHAAILTA